MCRGCVKCRDANDDTLISQSGDQQTVIARSVLRARRCRAAAAEVEVIGPATLAVRADSENEATAEAFAWGPQNDLDDGSLSALHRTSNRRRLARRRTEALYENVSAATNTYDRDELKASRIAAVRSRLTRALAAKED